MESTLQSSRQQVNKSKTKLDELIAGPESTQKRINELEQQEPDLLAKLEQTHKNIAWRNRI
jgi:chaperonin cofactor prefoldin